MSHSLLNRLSLKGICCSQTIIIRLTHMPIQTLCRYVYETVFEKRNRRAKCICIFIFEIYCVQWKSCIPTSDRQERLFPYEVINRACYWNFRVLLIERVHIWTLRASCISIFVSCLFMLFACFSTGLWYFSHLFLGASYDVKNPYPWNKLHIYFPGFHLFLEPYDVFCYSEDLKTPL